VVGPRLGYAMLHPPTHKALLVMVTKQSKNTPANTPAPVAKPVATTPAVVPTPPPTVAGGATVVAPVATTPAPVAPVAQPAPAPVTNGNPHTPAVAAMLANLNIVGGLGGIPNSTPAPAPAAPVLVKTPGVNPNARTRAGFAGLVIAQMGHANGITPNMVGMLCTMYGVQNATESQICLRNAWHAIGQYCKANGITPPPALPAPTANVTAPNA